MERHAQKDFFTYVIPLRFIQTLDLRPDCIQPTTTSHCYIINAVEIWFYASQPSSFSASLPCTLSCRACFTFIIGRGGCCCIQRVFCEYCVEFFFLYFYFLILQWELKLKCNEWKDIVQEYKWRYVAGWLAAPTTTNKVHIVFFSTRASCSRIEKNEYISFRWMKCAHPFGLSKNRAIQNAKKRKTKKKPNVSAGKIP